MDPRKNPYAPGAGTPPPELAGRDDILEKISIQLDRCRNGLSFRGFLMGSFFRVRFDRLTPSEKRYLRAMAELGEGSCRSGDIAHVLKKEVNSVAPVRATLISKGMIFSPSHGDNSFTVPLFEGYLKRVMPGTSWQQS